MNTYEFTAKISNGVLEVPQEFVHAMPLERDIRVILVVDEHIHRENANRENGIRVNDIRVNGISTDVAQGQTLEELVQEIKSLPKNSENYIPGRGRLAEALARSGTDPDPEFDEERWNQQWAAHEAEMKARSLAHEQEEWAEIEAQMSAATSTANDKACRSVTI